MHGQYMSAIADWSIDIMFTDNLRKHEITISIGTGFSLLSRRSIVRQLLCKQNHNRKVLLN